MLNLASQIRYALRQFRQAPVFTASAVLTLALGIGGTTAIFSLIHTLMLRSLPVADPASLYRIGDGNDCCVEGGPQDRWGMYSFPLFQRLKVAAPEFEQLAAFSSFTPQFSVRRIDTERLGRSLAGEYVTGNYFSTFGIRPFLGRLLSPEDDRPSAPPVAVLSYQAWSGTYGASPRVIGSSFSVNGRPFTIVGVAPPGFFGETLRADPPDIWLPLQQEPLIDGTGELLHQSVSAWLRVIGRVRPGATITPVSARLTALLRHWIQTESGYPAAWMPDLVRMLPKQVINVVPAGSGVEEMKEHYSRSLHILLIVCGLVLLIACANVANLLLARSLARRADLAVRVAIGAPARRLISAALTESVLLSLAGGIAGLAVAYAADRLLLQLAFHGARGIPISVAPSLPVLGFAFGLSLLTGVLFGAAPAWFATHTDPIDALRGAHRSSGDRSSLSRNALLAVQAMFSVVLIAGATMLARSLGNLEHQDFGFATANRITVELNPLPAAYTLERLDALYKRLEERLQQLPGVQHAGLALYNPLTDNWGELIYVDGRPPARISTNSVSSWDRVSPGYFETLGQPLLRGRAFTEHDTDRTELVAIVNQTFVKRFFPNEDPIGKRFGIDLPENARTYRIVGVVRDAKYTQLNKPVRPMFFVPLAQHAQYQADLLQRLELRSHFIEGVLLETSLPAGSLEPVLKKVFAGVDPNLTLRSMRPLEQQVALSFSQERAVASLAMLFGLVALILAGIGLYGVMAYNVAQRTSEIGIRMALGADRAKVVGLVLRSAFKRAALGLLLGIPLAVGAGRLISAQLFEVKSWDPAALAVATLALALCAFLAALIPATRAASIEPMQALRVE
jgi:predicted permease